MFAVLPGLKEMCFAKGKAENVPASTAIQKEALIRTEGIKIEHRYVGREHEIKAENERCAKADRLRIENDGNALKDVQEEKNITRDELAVFESEKCDLKWQKDDTRRHSRMRQQKGERLPESIVHNLE
jgi:hypothetical protein